MSISLKNHSKASILETLTPEIKTAKVLPLNKLSYKDWQSEASLTLDFDPPYIVRSSSPDEDNEQTTNAGHFESVLNVVPQDLDMAIKAVFDSYGTQKEQGFVFIQPMLQDVVLSGVMFTRDPSNGGYHYIINYDDTSSSTESVTSGADALLKVYYHFKNTEITKAHENMRAILLLGKELENILAQDNLDIEFAITSQKELYLFQVRTLHIPSPTLSLEEMTQLMSRVNVISHKFFKSHPYLHGERSILGVMPDWNPAEIVGIRPKKLALSLYKELITDRQWAYQRFEYGYRNVKSFPLIYDFLGLPYVDVRVSFNSFIPNSLDNKIAQKLASYYLQQLHDNPHYHDKIEFHIVLSCFTFNLSHKLDQLRAAGFVEKEIQAITDSLRDLTNTIIKDNDNLTYKDYQKIAELKNRQQEIMQSDLSIEDKIYWLLEDCKRYGTLAFAGLARAGFIGVELVNSLKAIGFFSDDEFEEFMNSIESISSNIYQDFFELPKEEFLKIYGHLRPGTYDIMSPRYDEKEYFVESEKSQTTHVPFKITLESLQNLDTALIENGLECSASSFLSFCKFAIEAREYGKFVFTKSLSDTLKLLEELGQQYGISREDIAFFDIKDFFAFYTTCDDRKTALMDSINKGKRSYQNSLLCTFPPIIRSYNDFYSFVIEEAQANYITMGEVSAEIIVLDDVSNSTANLTNKIVLIPSADPGYDWVFSHNVVGLITKYGGANSHMAIRAAELLLPSIIGCGELLFNQYSLAKQLYINCANKECKVLK